MDDAKFKEAFKLVDLITSIHTIECVRCNLQQVSHTDDVNDAMEHFYESGWRVFRNKCYCQHCAKK